MGYKNYQPLRLKEIVTLYDVPVEVSFSYSAPIEATEFEPRCEEDVEIESIVVDEFDIYNLVGEKALAKLYEELYKLIDERKEEIG